jgi:Flp pilus assembly protein TadG
MSETMNNHQKMPARSQAQSGHAMVELAICAGVMVLFLSGTFQFGYTFYLYNRLVTAVGNGARYAAQRTYRSATSDDVERGNTAIRNMVIYGDPQPAADAEPVVPNLTPEQLDVSWVKTRAGIPTAVDLSVHNYTVNAVFRSFTFDGSPSVEFPWVGRYAPGEREQ